MPYKFVGPLSIYDTGAMRGAKKDSVVSSLRKIYELRARQKHTHIIAAPALIEIIATEFAVIITTMKTPRIPKVVVAASLGDAEVPVFDEEEVRGQISSVFNYPVRFGYLACAWPSNKEGNGSSGPGVFITMANENMAVVENRHIIELVERVGNALGKLRHFYVLGKPSYVLERE